MFPPSRLGLYFEFRKHGGHSSIYRKRGRRRPNGRKRDAFPIGCYGSVRRKLPEPSRNSRPGQWQSYTVPPGSADLDDFWKNQWKVTVSIIMTPILLCTRPRWSRGLASPLTRSLPETSISHNLLFVHSPWINFSPLTIIAYAEMQNQLRIYGRIYNLQNNRSGWNFLVANQCDRLLCSLAFVEPTTLALLPVCRTSQASFMLVTRTSTNPGTWGTPSATCLTSSLQNKVSCHTRIFVYTLIRFVFTSIIVPFTISY